MAKKIKVPKKIAGVKLPKALRQGLKDLAASQNGRKALTEALAAAGTALAASQPSKSKAADLSTANADSASEAPGQTAADARSATVAALEDAARSFTDSLKRRVPPEAPSVTTPPSAATH
jgi:hypothetical protein